MQHVYMRMRNGARLDKKAGEDLESISVQRDGGDTSTPGAHSLQLGAEALSKLVAGCGGCREGQKA